MRGTKLKIFIGDCKFLFNFVKFCLGKMEKEDNFKSISLLTERAFGEIPKEIISLPQSGSHRKYSRVILNDRDCVFCLSSNIEENKTFIRLASAFHKKGVNVPEIYAVSPDWSSYILEDLGNVQLLDVIKKDPESQDLQRLVDASLRSLVEMQFLPAQVWEQNVEFPPLDEDLILYDFRYAEEQFFRRIGLTYSRDELGSELNMLKERLLSFPKHLWGFMYRDFQSRNIMIYKDEPWFIDFQSGRRGPCIYDFVSFAWQARAGFTHSQRIRMLEEYSCRIGEKVENVGSLLKENVAYWAVFRMLQVLGAYGLRGLKEEKRHFIESIPPALEEFNNLLEGYRLNHQFPTLSKIINECRDKAHSLKYNEDQI